MKRLSTIARRRQKLSNIQAISEKEFEQEVLLSPVPVLVDFWAPWCPPCQMLGPILEKFASEVKDKIKVVKVNTDENPDLALRFNISSIPNLLFFKDGKLSTQLVGLHDEKELKAKLGL